MLDKTHDALVQALNSNRVKMFRKILKRKGWPKSSRWSDYEFLVKALRLGRKRIVHVILDNDARVSKSVQLNSPLHIAASKATTSWTKVIARLLSHGARVADKNFRGDTALHVAFNSNAPGEAIDLMLQAHLLTSNRRDVVNKDGLRLLHIACARSDLDVDKLMRFVDKTNVNSQVCLESKKEYAGYTALHFAVENVRHEVAELLIKQGASIDKGDCNGSTPLHLALRQRNVRMIDLLLAHDVRKKNLIDKCSLSHFMAACAGSKHSIVKAYLAESQSHTPLYDMLSAQAGKVDNSTGYTPLHFAIDLGQADAVEILLEQGADCCVTTTDSLTPHDLAEKRGDENVCRALREHCEIVNTCMTMRSQDVDFSCWGDDYERCILIERVKHIKQLRKTLHDFKCMSAHFQPPIQIIHVD